MKFSTIAVAVGAVAAAALFAGGPYAFRQWVQSRAKANHARGMQHYAELHPKPAALPTAAPFTRVQAVTFLETAQTAEAIKDPLKRCLAYPDPPGSHWSPAAVRAYCHYRYQPVLGMDEIRRLIQGGQAARLDQLLADALKAQQTDPDARGRLDRIYETNFNQASFTTRELIDAWKRQDPDSAFAYAASGVAYAAAAWKARGADYIYKTPRSNIEAMERLAHLADTDLQHAIKLNPHIAPAYRWMISLGGMTLGGDYAMTAVKRSLVETPDDLGVYDEWMWLEQPNWFGSYAAMDDVALRAAGRVVTNPLLALDTNSMNLFRIRRCDCTSQQTEAQYRAAAKQLMGYGDLEHAGDVAKDANDPAGMAIFYSEALRFNDEDQDARSGRGYVLAYYDFPRWAITDADRALAGSPADAYALVGRGFAREKLHDWPGAKNDFKAAAALDPKNAWTLGYLGGAYASTCEWNGAWQVADQLVKLDPANLQGWRLRAVVEVYGPRSGIADTMTNLEQRFGSKPEIRVEVGQLAKIRQQREQQRAKAARDHKPVRLETVPPPWFHQCRQYANVKLAPAPGHGLNIKRVPAPRPHG